MRIHANAYFYFKGIAEDHCALCGIAGLCRGSSGVVGITGASKVFTVKFLFGNQSVMTWGLQGVVVTISGGL